MSHALLCRPGCGRFVGGLLLGAGLALGPAATAGAVSEELRRELAEVSLDIKKRLDFHELKSVSVGQFTGPASFPSSGGVRIAKVLAEELARQGVTVKSGADLGVSGEYFPAKAPAEPPAGGQVPAVRLKVNVKTLEGETDAAFDRIVRGETEVIEQLGLPADFSGQGKGQTPKQRADTLFQGFKKPPLHVNGSLVSVAPGSPYKVEILVKGAPCRVEPRDGLAFAELRPQDVYAVRLVNDSPLEAAVRLSIDGLSVFEFSDLRQPEALPDGGPNPKKGQPLLGAVIVPAHGAVVVRGWHRTNEESDEFLITGYARSAAALKGQTADIGTITAIFSAAWPKDAAPPEGEPATGSRGIDDGFATGFGARIAARYHQVERTIGAVRASVAIRYDRPPVPDDLPK